MNVRIRRLLIAALLAEFVTVAMLTALVPALVASGTGTLVYQIMRAQSLALWIAPIGGFLACTLAGWWVAWGDPVNAQRNGLILGGVVTVLDLVLLGVSGAPFGALMVLSVMGRIAGGYAGGWFAGRKRTLLAAEV